MVATWSMSYFFLLGAVVGLTFGILIGYLAGITHKRTPPR